MRGFYTFGKTVCAIVFKTWYKVIVDGKENVPTDRGVIIICNHKSYFDPILVGVSLKVPLNFIAKEELFKNKIAKLILWNLGAIPIARGSADMSAINTAIKRVSESENLLLFPEGTRSKTNELLRFKSGATFIASQTNTDIVPAAIHYSGNKFRSKVYIKFGELIKFDDLGLDPQVPSTARKTTSLFKQKVEELFNLLRKN